MTGEVRGAAGGHERDRPDTGGARPAGGQGHADEEHGEGHRGPDTYGRSRGKPWIRFSANGADPVFEALAPVVQAMGSSTNVQVRLATVKGARIASAVPGTADGVPVTVYTIPLAETNDVASIDAFAALSPAVRRLTAAQLAGTHGSLVMSVDDQDLVRAAVTTATPPAFDGASAERTAPVTRPARSGSPPVDGGPATCVPSPSCPSADDDGEGTQVAWLRVEFHVAHHLPRLGPARRDHRTTGRSGE